MSLGTLAALNTQRKRKLCDIKEMIGLVSSQHPNMIHFMFTDEEFECLYFMISHRELCTRANRSRAKS